MSPGGDGGLQAVDALPPECGPGGGHSEARGGDSDARGGDWGSPSCLELKSDASNSF